MRKSVFLFAVLSAVAGMSAYAQLSLEACREKSRTNYPLAKQYGLIDRAADYAIFNYNTGYLPQLSASGKSTNQSDVTPMGGLTRDQYQVALDITQTIWDGGAIGAQKKMRSASALVDKRKNDVDMHALDERVDQIFFSVLLFSAQLDQNAILQDELETNAERVAAYIANGIANRSDADAIEVERVDARQKRIELSASLEAYTAMLSALIGEAIPVGTRFVRPEKTVPALTPAENHRAELALFDAQCDLLLKQKSAAFAASSPRLSAFGQLAYGKPGLNTLESGPVDYWVAGIRIQWNLGTLYTLRGSLKEIEANQKMVETQRDVFLFNSRLNVDQQYSEIRKIEKLIAGDDELITLRGRIKKAAEARSENGTLSVPDLIREINAENLAAQIKILHEIQLQIAIRNLESLVNN